MNADRLHMTDKVLVEIYLDGKKIDTSEESGVHTVAQAVRNAYDASAHATKDIEDYVFRVTDQTDQTSARYRVNAGGNLKLIVEE